MFDLNDDGNFGMREVDESESREAIRDVVAETYRRISAFVAEIANDVANGDGKPSNEDMQKMHYVARYFANIHRQMHEEQEKQILGELLGGLLSRQSENVPEQKPERPSVPDIFRHAFDPKPGNA